MADAAVLLRVADAICRGGGPAKAAAFETALADVPLHKLGMTVKEPRLRIAGANGEWIIWAPLAQLKEAWQKPLRW